jgi:hypothetical protein
MRKPRNWRQYVNLLVVVFALTITSPAARAMEPNETSPAAEKAVVAPVEKLDDNGKHVYRIDFRNGNFDLDALMPTPANSIYALQLLKPEPRGIRTTIPQSQGATKPSLGFLSLFKVIGDFEITASYELLAVETPKRNTMPGAEIYVKADDMPHGVLLRRCIDSTGKQLYLTHFHRLNENGKDTVTRRSFPADANWGCLQLKRTAETLEFLVAEEDALSFRKLGAIAFGSAPVGLLSLGVATDGDLSAVEARWKVFSVKAVELQRPDIPILRTRKNSPAPMKDEK